MLIEKLKNYQIYRQWDEYIIEVAITRILHKHIIKIEAYQGGHINVVYVRRLVAVSYTLSN